MAINDPLRLFNEHVDFVLSNFVLPVSSIHGPVHWARVLENGLRLAPLTGADPVVITLFALFHDSCRHNDGGDIFHGPRAAKWLRKLDLNISESQHQLLIEACAGHTNSLSSLDVTVGTCWDSDRLDIGRIGVVVNPKFMSTKAAKDSAILAWAQERAAYGQVPDFADRFL